MDINQFLLSATEAVNQAAGTVHETASGDVLGTLGINWKIFLAQLVNFSIVLFVFWRWVVKPLGQTLTRRQEKIEQGLKDAEAAEKNRVEFEQWKIEEMKKVRNEADNIVRMAADTANKLKQETIVETNLQAQKLLDQAKTMIDSEKQQMLQEVKEEVAELVVLSSEKIIRAKLDARKDHELINTSIKNIQ